MNPPMLNCFDPASGFLIKGNGEDYYLKLHFIVGDINDTPLSTHLPMLMFSVCWYVITMSQMRKSPLTFFSRHTSHEITDAIDNTLVSYLIKTHRVVHMVFIDSHLYFPTLTLSTIKGFQSQTPE